MSKYCPDCGKENKDTAKFCLGCGEKFDQAGTILINTPKVLDNRYEIICTIKSGAMGCVFKAKDTRLNNIVAVKQMLSSFTNPQEASYVETRFAEEARMLSALKHNGLPKVIDYFTEKEPSTGKVLHYLVMEFIEGKDLETVIHERSKKPFSIKETVDIMRQILDILSYLHGQKPPIIYRDLNPRNIMISGGKVFLVDFGIAKVLTPQQKGTAIGTAGYAAPEQYKGESDIQSDIYSLGAMMHYLLTGHDPEHGTIKLFTFEQIRTVNSSVPEYLESLVMSMVEVVPGKRPSDSDAVKGVLEKSAVPTQAVAQRGVLAASPQSVAHPTPPVSKPQSVAPPAPPVLKPQSVPPAPPVSKPQLVAPPVSKLSPSTWISVALSTLLLIALFLGYSASRQSTGPSVPPGKEPRGTAKMMTNKVKVNPKDGAAMIFIPAGEFLMGSPERTGSDAERPQHRVYLDACYIYKYEVTNGQFAKFVNATGYSAEGNWKTYAKSGRETHPVVCVTWNDAAAYCKWAGGSLPTEAQWEKAARGTDGRVYPWGNTWDGNRCNWYEGPKVSGLFDICGGRGTAPVGSFPSGMSNYGVHDMAGNVWEWCSDWYDENYYRKSPSGNPEGPGRGSSRVLRGGSWGNVLTDLLCCAFRNGSSPGLRLNGLGFRVCRHSNTP